MTRRKLNNPTKLRTGVELADSPAPGNNEILDLVIRSPSSPPLQEDPIDCSWKRPRLDDDSDSSTLIDRKPPSLLSQINSQRSTMNGHSSTCPIGIKKEPQVAASRPFQAIPVVSNIPTLSSNSTNGNNNNNNNNSLGGLSAVPAVWLNSILTQQPTSVRVPTAGFANQMPIEVANFDGNLQALLNTIRDQQQLERYMSMLPKPPTSDLMKADQMLVVTYSAITVKALELFQLIGSYEDFLRNAERTVANGTRPLQLNGSSTNIVTNLPPLQTSPSAGSLSPLNSPHFPPGSSNGQQARPLAPAHRRLSAETEAALCALAPATPGLSSDANRAGLKRPLSSGRKRNDRRADTEMNEPNLEFVPKSYVDADSVEQVQLSSKFPSVIICREKFNEIIRKGESSATRVIRMIMKHFFEPEVLAVSSLSGTGQYKEVLNLNVVNAIKDFISNRYPKLRSSRLNLCMTDVCVQARRVKTNQSRRSGTLVKLDSEELEGASMSQALPDTGSALDSNSSNDAHPNEHYDLDLNVTAPSLPAALEDRPLSPPSEGEGELVIG